MTGRGLGEAIGEAHDAHISHEGIELEIAWTTLMFHSGEVSLYARAIRQDREARLRRAARVPRVRIHLGIRRRLFTHRWPVAFFVSPSRRGSTLTPHDHITEQKRPALLQHVAPRRHGSPLAAKPVPARPGRTGGHRRALSGLRHLRPARASGFSATPTEGKRHRHGQLDPKNDVDASVVDR